jgi:predicted dehydrogenase
MIQRNATRRDFLKISAAAAAAGAAAPYFCSSSFAKPEAKSDKLGVGSIGVGGRGSGIGREASALGNTLACCDVDRSHAERFAAGLKSGKVDIYDDYRKLLDRHDIQVVTIGTPDHWHVPIALAALKAGKDVYCEKPLTLTIDEGKMICKVVKETGRVFQVGTQQRSDFRFLLAIAVARSGRLGKKITATCSIGGAPAGGPFATAEPPKGLNWEMWLGQAPRVPYTKERCHGNFRWWLEYSGGKLTDWGAHHVDIATWGLGFEHTGPIEIEGHGTFPNHPADFNPVAFYAGKQTLPNGYHAATQFQCKLTFANGNQIIVRDGPDNGIWFDGEAGRIFVNRGKITGEPVEELAAQMEEKTITVGKNQRKSQVLQLKPEAQDRFDKLITQLYKGKERKGHMQNFFECIQDRGEPVSDVYTHHRELTSCHMCNIAMLLKRKLRWDPEQQQFLGDDEANQLLSRPQRAPYTFSAT